MPRLTFAASVDYDPPGLPRHTVAYEGGKTYTVKLEWARELVAAGRAAPADANAAKALKAGEADADDKAPA